MNDGTVDITDLVERAREAFVTAGADFIYSAVVVLPGFTWLTWPIISPIFKTIIKKLLEVLSTWGLLQMFIMNTILKKPAQAKDWIDALNKKLALPKDVSEADYEKAEQMQIEAFNNFVVFTN